MILIVNMLTFILNVSIIRLKFLNIFNIKNNFYTILKYIYTYEVTNFQLENEVSLEIKYNNEYIKKPNF